VGASTDPSSPEQIGLRERKKLRTKAMLTDAALRLFAQRGFDEVTIEDIAAEVEVSPRTFFRYFASKEDALFGDVDATLEAIRDGLARRPPGEPDVVAIREAVLSVAQRYTVDPGPTLERASVVTRTPSLLAHAAGRQAAYEEAIARTLAERRGAVCEPTLRERLLAAFAIAALRVAFDAWVERGGTDAVLEIASEALDRLEAGFGR